MEITWILPTLGVGGEITVAQDIEGIESVLNLRRLEDADFVRNLHYAHIQIDDCVPLSEEDVIKAVKWIDNQLIQDRKTYVHCGEGISRSPVIVTSYLVYTGKSVDEAFYNVRSKHKKTSIHPNILNSLYSMESRLQQRI